MPFYHKLGKIPPKRHTVFRKPNGDLYYEQLFGTIGFDGMSSNLYHEHRPTMVKEIKGKRRYFLEHLFENMDILKPPLEFSTA
jgi:homogentisate 1,2-dioxygenase